MKLRYIEEPSLQFGDGQHICPKQGISLHSPFDHDQVRPERITLGIIGKSESIEKVLAWLDSCKSHIGGKQSKNPHPKLFPSFPGFNKQTGFLCNITWDDSYIRKLKNSEFDAIIRKHENLEDRIKDIGQLYLDEIKFLAKNKNPDVILCALNENFITYITEDTVLLNSEEEEQ
ncbi:MAG TPA: hypothetical protein VK772_02035, partial [Puia sp.]|nr:hypothetical protein [Puia sp.]